MDIASRLALPEGLEVSPVGIQVTDPELPFEAFEQAISAASRMRDAGYWILGDLFLFGALRYGHDVDQALDGRVSLHQVNRYRYVCERVVRSRRRENLPFSHHEEVAPLEPDDQDRILEQAAAKNWSREQVREAVRDLRVLTKQPRQQLLAKSEGDSVGAAAALATAKDSLALTYQHLRDPGQVDALTAAEAIPPALRALEEASETILQAERRLAGPSLLEAARKAVGQATRSSGFAMVPDEVFDALATAVAAEGS